MTIDPTTDLTTGPTIDERLDQLERGIAETTALLRRLCAKVAITGTADATTSTPPAPARLKLDAIVPPELRARLAAATAGLNAILADGVFEAACRVAYEAHRDYDLATDTDLLDRDRLDELCGIDKLWTAAARIASMGQAAVGARPEYVNVEWVDDDEASEGVEQ